LKGVSRPIMESVGTGDVSRIIADERQPSPENSGRVHESRILDSRILEKALAFSGRAVIVDCGSE